MSEQIKDGDSVCLKSGGPAMTVQLVYKADSTQGTPTMARCSWFNGNSVMQHDFNIFQLIKSESLDESKLKAQ